LVRWDGMKELNTAFLGPQNLNEATYDDRSVLFHLQELSESIKAVQKRLDSLEVKTETIDLIASKVSMGFEMAEGMLGKIAHALGVEEGTTAGDDEEDRKRLKVRLKEALESKQPLTDENEPMGFLEHYFGICRPNERIGKHGSRSA
jgi:hypothetical protein